MDKIRENIEEKYKKAVRGKNEVSIKTLRLLKSAIKDRDIANRTDTKKELSEQEIIMLFQNLIKQRNESIVMYKKGGREELAKVELEEIGVIKDFLPSQLTPEEIKKIIHKIIKEDNLGSIKDMGKIMSLIKLKYSGKIDMSIAGKLAKEIFNS